MIGQLGEKKASVLTDSINAPYVSLTKAQKSFYYWSGNVEK